MGHCEKCKGSGCKLDHLGMAIVDSECDSCGGSGFASNSTISRAWHNSILDPPRPYGSNEGDIWLMGDYFQDHIQAEKGPGWRVIVEVMRNEDGKLEEHFYTTEVPELVEAADKGNELMLAQIARNN